MIAVNAPDNREIPYSLDMSNQIYTAGCISRIKTRSGGLAKITRWDIADANGQHCAFPHTSDALFGYSGEDSTGAVYVTPKSVGVRSVEIGQTVELGRQRESENGLSSRFYYIGSTVEMGAASNSRQLPAQFPDVLFGSP
jgi:hypothetical protein